MFRDLMFGRREPSYVAFDILFLDGEDVRELPLRARKSLLESVVRRNVGPLNPAPLWFSGGVRKDGTPACEPPWPGSKPQKPLPGVVGRFRG